MNSDSWHVAELLSLPNDNLKDAGMWSISNNGSSVESAQATSNSADLFVPSSSWALSGQQAAVQASGGATSNDSEPSPATTASPASQGRAGTVAPGVQQQLATQTAPQSQASAAASKLPVASTSAASGKVKRRKWTREERAEHSTIEKKRREDFNVSLLVSPPRAPYFRQEVMLTTFGYRNWLGSCLV